MSFFNLGNLSELSIDQIIRLILSQSLFGSLAAMFSIVGDLFTLALNPLSLFTNSYLG